MTEQSGLTYKVERCAPPGPWVVIADGLLTTNYTDSSVEPDTGVRVSGHSTELSWLRAAPPKS